MRAVALCVLVLVASASAAWNTLTKPASVSSYVVSQTGLIPGQTQISTDSLAAGQIDVRTGQPWASTYTAVQTADFEAPYAGCYYFYNVDRTYISSACTSWAEWKVPATPRTPAAVNMSFASNNSPSVSTTAYTFNMTFRVDAGYAGTAFEFLNLNDANPTDSDTRCGVAYNNLTAPDVNNKIPSPHSNAGQSFNIVNPGITADNGVWSFTDLFTGVTADSASTPVSFGTVQYHVANFNTVLQKCGWFRDEASSDFVIYRAQIRVTTVQQGRSIRGVLYKSIKETVIAVGISFDTRVTATSGTINVNNELILFAQVKKQVFDPIQRIAYLLLFTSSQGPYQLEPYAFTDAEAKDSVACSDPANTGCAVWTQPVTAFHYLSSGDVNLLKLPTASNDDDGQRTAGSGSRAECYNQTNGVPDYQLESPQAYSQCNQYWFLQLGAPSDCGSSFTGTQNLNGNWNVTYNIKCHSSYKGSCTIAAPIKNTISVLFGTQSDNYCPRIVDTITATANLKVYQDTTYAESALQSQFVFGTTSYFVASVQSTVQMSALHTEEVAITRGGQLVNHAGASGDTLPTPFIKPDTTTGTDRQVIYSASFNSANPNNAAPYFATREAADCQTGGSTLNTKLSGGVLTGTQETGTGYFGSRCYYRYNTIDILDYSITQYNTSGTVGELEAKNLFQWYWNEAVSKATGDFAEITEVKWIGRLRYTDQATPAPKVSFTMRANHLDAVGTTTASVTSTMSAPQASAPSQAAISTTTIAVAAAAVAAVAVMAIAAFVVLRSRNVKAEAETNLESVTLGSVHSASSAQL